VRRIVTVCPGCHLRLEPVAAELAPEMEFVSLAKVLVDAGVRVSPAALGGCALPIAVVDSCQDRAGAHGPAIRALLEQVESVSFPEAGKDARCCGASGSVNTVDGRFVRACTRHQLRRGVQAGVGTLITACPTCAYTYAFERRTCEAEGDASWQGIGSLNYLELVFDQRIDWPAVFHSLEDLWTGERAAWAMRVLAAV
jgi:Fe-S oxidoreductase